MKVFNKRIKLLNLVIFIILLGLYTTKVQAEEDSNTENETTYEVTTIEFLDEAEPIEYTQEELDCLASVMYAEAGGCDDTELYLVANVVINRVNDKSGNFKDSIIDVIYQKGQFTSVNGEAWNRGPTEREYAIAEDVLQGKRVALSNVYWFSKGMSYGNVYYKSEWHYFSGMDLKQQKEEKTEKNVKNSENNQESTQNKETEETAEIKKEEENSRNQEKLAESQEIAETVQTKKVTSEDNIKSGQRQEKTIQNKEKISQNSKNVISLTTSNTAKDKLKQVCLRLQERNGLIKNEQIVKSGKKQVSLVTEYK